MVTASSARSRAVRIRIPPADADQGLAAKRPSRSARNPIAEVPSARNAGVATRIE
jgi:hypothetical protein